MANTNTKANENDGFAISETKENILITFFINEYDLLLRCLHMINPMHFTDDNQKIVKYIVDYQKKYNKSPTRDQIIADLDISKVGVIDYDTQDETQQKWFLDTFNDFVHFHNGRTTFIETMDDLNKGNYDAIPDKFKKAFEMGFQHDFGLDWHADPEERTQRILDSRGGSSTGWTALDAKLFGGFSRGELNFFLGGSNSGKSIFLVNLAYNWQQAGLNVLYITLEMKPELMAQRADQIHMGWSTQKVISEVGTMSASVKMDGKNEEHGKLIFHAMGGLSTNANSIRSFVKEYEVQKKHTFDAIVVDYMDLMIPNDKSVDPNSKFLVDHYISTELRELAKSEHVLMVSASQMNRSGAEIETGYGHQHIAGGISKIYNADNIMAIITNNAMRERGEYKLQMMKTRSSKGIGSFVPLKYDVDSMRVSDFSEEELAAMKLEKGETGIKRDSVVATGTADTKEVAMQKAAQLEEAIKNVNNTIG